MACKRPYMVFNADIRRHISALWRFHMAERFFILFVDALAKMACKRPYMVYYAIRLLATII